MKQPARQPVIAKGKGTKPPAKDITVSISQKKAAGAAAGATLGAIAAGPIGALVGGVVGGLVADNTDAVKKEVQSASKAVLKKAPSLKQVEKAVVKAGKKTVVALKSGGAKAKAALVSPTTKPAASKPKAVAKKKAAPKAPAKPVKAPVKAKLPIKPPASKKAPAKKS
jgi:hypothetical protein